MDAKEIARAIPRPWIEWTARIGLAAKGVAYLLVCVFALTYAMGGGRDAKDFRGALNAVESLPFGSAALVALGLGLASYAMWRTLQALTDPENREPAKPRIFKRIGYAISATAHFWLSFAAFKAAYAGSKGSDHDAGAKNASAQALSIPLGQYLIAIAGAGVLAYGLAQAYYGVRQTFWHKLKGEQMSSREDAWTAWSARLGFIARGVVFCTIGWFLLAAALDYNPREVKGMEQSLEFLGRRPFGFWLLTGVALGLGLYGVFMLIQARRRRIKTP